MINPITTIVIVVTVSELMPKKGGDIGY